LPKYVSLGQEQRQQRKALLALGSVGAQIACVAQDGEIITMWSMGAEATPQIVG
jgi:hypothetical protein